MTTSEEIARLRGLLERATPGPWRTEQRDRDDMDGQRYNSEGPCLVMSPECGSHPVADTSANHTCGLAIEDNAALIVAMRNALPALLDDVERLGDLLETERMRLAACGVAAQCNTEESIAEHGIGPDSPYYSASYEDVCAAVRREMALRGRVVELENLIGEWAQAHDGTDYVVQTQTIHALRAALGSGA